MAIVGGLTGAFVYYVNPIFRIIMKHIRFSCTFSSVCFVLLYLIISTTNLRADSKLNGEQIMQKMQQQSRIHANQKFDVFMRIIDKKGRVRTRFFTSWKKYTNNDSHSLVRFYRPANLKNTGLLSIFEDARDETEQWLYLPAFRSIKKLSADEKNKSFMGSDFTNSDIGGRDVDADTHRLVSQDKTYYFVESVPKSKDDNYSKIRYKIHKRVMVPTRVEFFDDDGKNTLIKRLENKKIVKHKGMYITTLAHMVNPNTKSTTIIEIRAIDTDVTKSLSFFSTRGLKQ